MQHKTMERLVLFNEVAKQLSFAKAAEILNISKGHLSEQIKTLELELGTPLLVRTTRSVRLTSEGQQVLHSSNEINYVFHHLEQRLKHLDGCIRITAPKLFTERFLLPLVEQFRQLHPDVRVQLDTSYTRYDLNQANFDMAFRATHQPPENMIAKRLLSYQHTLAASPEYLTYFQAPNSPFDLNKHICLTGEEQVNWAFKQGEVNVNGAIVSNDNHLLKQMAIQGQGIIRLPDYYLSEEICSGQLVPLLETDKVSGFDIYLLYPTSTRETARLRQFITFVSQFDFLNGLT